MKRINRKHLVRRPPAAGLGVVADAGAGTRAGNDDLAPTSSLRLMSF